jgi:hypothetical protein
MTGDLKFQLRLTLSEEFADVARNDPGDPSISTLTDILKRHDAVLKCQFDAFADYVGEAEAKGIENFPLYEWTKKTIDDPAKEAKYTKSFTLYVGGEEVYEKAKADPLARISHAIFAQLSRVARGLTSFFKGVLARVVRRTRAELGFFLSRGERQRVVSVGRGMMPRL